MKDDFLNLISRMPDIEKLFHVTPSQLGLAIPNVPELFDVQECQIWLQAVTLEVQDIIDRTGDLYAKGTLDVLSKKHNGYNDKRDFDEIKGRLLAMKGQVDKYYVDKETTSSDMPKVFVSHSSKDKEYVKLVVSLLNDMGLSSDQIFCSSLPGYDIPLSDKIFDYLRKQFSEFNLHLIIIHSKNYYRSAVCLNEMGAAWVHRNRCTSILLPGFDFADMTGVVNDETVAIKLDTDENELKDKLNQLYLELIEEFSLEKKKDILWENKRNAFIEGINWLIAIPPDKASTSSPNDRC